MGDSELERFKTEINLSAYAAAQGYQLIRRESSRNSVTMKHGNGDKIVIARGHDDHWIYFSVHNERDNGSIIDFVQNRQRCSLGGVRQRLRDWIGGGAPYPAPDYYQAEVRKTNKDRQGVIAAFGKMRDVEEHPYLNTRAVGKEILCDPRFRGRVKIDGFGNAVFPHFDEDGLCGYEIKNTNFTGLPPGSEKGLWISRCFPDDDTLVIAESAIDALSFHGLHGWPHARYASTAGGWSPKTVDLMQKAASECPGSKVVLAFDNDDAGRDYEAKAREFLAGCGKDIEAMYPPVAGDDWNDQLKKQASPAPAHSHRLL